MKAALPESLAAADRVHCYADHLGWDVGEALKPLGDKARIYDDLGGLVEALAREAVIGDHILIMSNGGFGGIHDKLIARLSA